MSYNKRKHYKNKSVEYISDKVENEEMQNDTPNNNTDKPENKKNIKKSKSKDKDIEINEIETMDDLNNLSDSMKAILANQEFMSPIQIKKENKLLTKSTYVTFKNSYAENSCYINVILQLIFNISELSDFIIDLYKIASISKEEKEKNGENYEFLVILGEILSKYNDIFNGENKYKRNKNQVNILETLNFRKKLEIISDNKFPLNSIADPVELLTFILELLNNYLEDELHKTLFLELDDAYYCEGKKKNCKNIINKYDKDNFIYHIYIDEILKHLEVEKLKVNTYKSKLFEYSYKLFLSENVKICQGCKNEMGHDLVCYNLPEYLLINCIWKESNPIVDDVVNFFMLMPLRDILSHLFVSQNKKQDYDLYGFILYSFSLSHYVLCLFNVGKKVFVLFDDEVIKEFKNLYSLIIDITVNTLKQNGKAFFYPVMLIFSKEPIYGGNEILKTNTLRENDYLNIIKMCNEAIYEYQLENEKNAEKDYEDMVEEQIKIETSIKKKRKQNSKNKKEEGKKEEEKEDEEEDEKEEEKCEKKSNEKTEKEKGDEVKKGLNLINRKIMNKIFEDNKKSKQEKSKNKNKSKDKKEKYPKNYEDNNNNSIEYELKKDELNLEEKGNNESISKRTNNLYKSQFIGKKMNLDLQNINQEQEKFTKRYPKPNKKDGTTFKHKII